MVPGFSWADRHDSPSCSPRAFDSFGSSLPLDDGVGKVGGRAFRAVVRLENEMPSDRSPIANRSWQVPSPPGQSRVTELPWGGPGGGEAAPGKSAGESGDHTSFASLRIT